MQHRRLALTVFGRVQGVGFRFFTKRNADRFGVTGWVRNCSDGSVAMEVQGASESVEQFRTTVKEGPSFAKVRSFQESELPFVSDEHSFTIRF